MTETAAELPTGPSAGLGTQDATELAEADTRGINESDATAKGASSSEPLQTEVSLMPFILIGLQ